MLKQGLFHPRLPLTLHLSPVHWQNPFLWAPNDLIRQKLTATAEKPLAVQTEMFQKLEPKARGRKSSLAGRRDGRRVKRVAKILFCHVSWTKLCAAFPSSEMLKNRYRGREKFKATFCLLLEGSRRGNAWTLSTFQLISHSIAFRMEEERNSVKSWKFEAFHQMNLWSSRSWTDLLEESLSVGCESRVSSRHHSKKMFMVLQDFLIKSNWNL